MRDQLGDAIKNRRTVDVKLMQLCSKSFTRILAFEECIFDSIHDTGLSIYVKPYGKIGIIEFESLSVRWIQSVYIVTTEGCRFACIRKSLQVRICHRLTGKIDATVNDNQSRGVHWHMCTNISPENSFHRLVVIIEEQVAFSLRFEGTIAKRRLACIKSSANVFEEVIHVAVNNPENAVMLF